MAGPDAEVRDRLDLRAHAHDVPRRPGGRPSRHHPLDHHGRGRARRRVDGAGRGRAGLRGSGHEGDASVTLSMGPVEFIKLVTKTGNPVMMVMMGKIKIKGDMALAANVGNLFEVPLLAERCPRIELPVGALMRLTPPAAQS